MPYVMHMSVSNDYRLEKDEYLFEYGGLRFKLIQNDPSKWADVLLTILPDHKEQYIEKAFYVASEFLSALSWKNKSKIDIGLSGGSGCDSFLKIEDATPSARTFPNFFSKGNVRGFSISPIPKIENEYQRKALALFREATASNNIYLSFLFYWQVLEVIDGKTAKYAFDEIFKSKSLKTFLPDHHIEELDLNGLELGDFLEGNCRHAIAHMTRYPKFKKDEIDINSYYWRHRILNSLKIIKAYAEHFICFKIELKKKLHLAKRYDDEFPIYYDLELAKKEKFKNIKIPYLNPIE